MLRGRGAAIRLMAGLALAVALAAAVAPFPDSRAAAQTEDNSLASITIYTVVCPPGYDGDDLFGDCYDNPAADVAYLLTGPAFPETVTNSTDAGGFTAFEGIDQPGEYLLQPDVALEFVAFCSDEFGDPFPIADESAVGGIGLDLMLDDDLRCDFYLIPTLNGAEGFPITAIATACAREPTAHPFAGGGCVPVPGVAVTYATVAGEVLAACVTEPSGPPAGSAAAVPVALCTVEVPFGATVVATADAAAFPAGYVLARPNPQTLAVPAGPPDGEFAGPVFLALPQAQEVPTPQPTQPPPTATTVTLPSTGIGTDSAGGASDPVGRLAAALALVAVAGASLAVAHARFAAGSTRVRR